VTPATAAVDSAIIDSLAGVLRRRPEVELALLFGSRARGRESAGSDVDVAVEGEGVDRLALARDLSAAVGAEVDVVDLRRAGYPLLRAVLRDGVLLHEGRPYAEARFRTRAILQTETDRPWFERMRDGYLKHLAEQARGRS
jgi:predicted nucleotidyltransferase